MTGLSIEDVLEEIRKAVHKVLAQGAVLIEKSTHEQTLSFRLGFYLAEKFEPLWNVDCEFDREIWGSKRRKPDGKIRSQRPDVVIHRRGTDEHNIALIEVKKAFDKATADEERRNIEDWISGSRNYQVGIRLAFGVRGDGPVCDFQFKPKNLPWSTTEALR